MTTPLKVLILEDRPDDSDLLVLELGRAGFDPDWQRVETRSDYEASLRPDLEVVLADYSLPQFDALQALGLLQDRGLDIPFIVVTGSFEDLAIDCMKQGAADYLIKDRLGRLGLAVQQAMQERQLRSEKRRAEEALRESENRFRSVAETAIAAIAVTDSQGKIRYWNKAAEKTFGYSEAEALGKALGPMIQRRPLDREGVKLTQAGEFVGRAAELVGLRKGGELFPVELSLADWKSDGEQFYSAIIRDLTEARAAQERAMRQDRLAAVGQLVAGIAPNFSNILAAIILHSEMVLGSFELSRRDEDRIRTILKQAERGAFLTRQILDFGRQSALDPELVDVAQFMAELETALTPGLQGAIQLSVVARDEGWFVNADPSRLRQAIMNLAQNAQEAMSEGGELRIELDSLLLKPEDTPPMNELAPGSWIRIRVVDTGRGIAEQDLPHIFEPFFTTKPADRGAGLGLAQANGIVKQHGGHIEVKSRRREGTEFIVYLPLVGEGSQPVQARGPAGGEDGSEHTILVVDDDKPTREAIGEMLSSLNYRTLLAEDGQEALKILQDPPQPISFVLTDLVMPNVGGAELLERLRAMKQEVPLVLMTSYPLGTEPQELLGNGLVGWLEKPLTESTLARTIRSVLRQGAHT